MEREENPPIGHRNDVNYIEMVLKVTVIKPKISK